MVVEGYGAEQGFATAGTGVTRRAGSRIWSPAPTAIAQSIPQTVKARHSTGSAFHPLCLWLIACRRGYPRVGIPKDVPQDDNLFHQRQIGADEADDVWCAVLTHLAGDSLLQGIRVKMPRTTQAHFASQ